MTYLCYTSYGATGEGQSEWVSTHYCDTEEDARRLHREKFALPEFFHQGILVLEVTDKNSARIKSLLEPFIAAPALQGLFGKCFMEMSFHFYANCS